MPEAMGLVPLWPGADHLIPLILPPPNLDIAGQFADDGVYGGHYTETLRSHAHFHKHMPKLGLQFGKAVVVPACPGGHQIPLAEVQAAGCTFDGSGSLEILRSPVGEDEWARRYTLARVQDTLDLVHALVSLPGAHAAFSWPDTRSGA